MAGVLLVDTLDVGRALGNEPTKATPESVADWLHTEYLKKRGGRFNYNPAMQATYDTFRGACTPDQAAMYCLTHGNPKGRRQNVAAIKKVAQYAAENVSTCYRIGFTAVVVGRIGAHVVYVGIKSPMVRVRSGQAFVVVPGFRMSYRPADREIDVACSIALANFARDDFASADFEYLYAGPGRSGEREFRAIRGSERRVFTRDEVDALLDIYVQGIALALHGGAEPRTPDLKGYRIIDPREPGLF